MINKKMMAVVLSISMILGFNVSNYANDEISRDSLEQCSTVTADYNADDPQDENNAAINSLEAAAASVNFKFSLDAAGNYSSTGKMTAFILDENGKLNTTEINGLSFKPDKRTFYNQDMIEEVYNVSASVNELKYTSAVAERNHSGAQGEECLTIYTPSVFAESDSDSDLGIYVYHYPLGSKMLLYWANKTYLDSFVSSGDATVSKFTDKGKLQKFFKTVYSQNATLGCGDKKTLDIIKNDYNGTTQEYYLLAAPYSITKTISANGHTLTCVMESPAYTGKKLIAANFISNMDIDGIEIEPSTIKINAEGGTAVGSEVKVSIKKFTMFKEDGAPFVGADLGTVKIRPIEASEVVDWKKTYNKEGQIVVKEKNGTIKNIKVILKKIGKYGVVKKGTYAEDNTGKLLKVKKDMYDYDSSAGTIKFKEGAFITGTVSLNSASK